MITSTGNAQVKNIIQLKNKGKVRREQDCFLVEGIRMFQEIPIEQRIKTYISETFFEEIQKQDLWEQLHMEETFYEVVSDKIFQTMSDTVTPQGILAVVRQSHRTLEELLMKKHSEQSHCYIILEDIQDPGNLGTILRTAEGAGVSGVIMSKNTADIYNPKVVRSTMGAIFRMPYVYVEDLQDAIGIMKAQGIKIYAAHLKGTKNYDSFDYTIPSAFMIGNEGNGLSEEIAGLADTYIRIPMCGQVESLNAAIAATVLMYESFRQNRKY
jgi:TrmH family RNA methyltransferase